MNWLELQRLFGWRIYVAILRRCLRRHPRGTQEAPRRTPHRRGSQEAPRVTRGTREAPRASLGQKQWRSYQLKCKNPGNPDCRQSVWRLVHQISEPNWHVPMAAVTGAFEHLGYKQLQENREERNKNCPRSHVVLRHWEFVHSAWALGVPEEHSFCHQYDWWNWEKPSIVHNLLLVFMEPLHTRALCYYYYYYQSSDSSSYYYQYYHYSYHFYYSLLSLFLLRGMYVRNTTTTTATPTEIVYEYL